MIRIRIGINKSSHLCKQCMRCCGSSIRSWRSSVRSGSSGVTHRSVYENAEHEDTAQQHGSGSPQVTENCGCRCQSVLSHRCETVYKNVLPDLREAPRGTTCGRHQLAGGTNCGQWAQCLLRPCWCYWCYRCCPHRVWWWAARKSHRRSSISLSRDVHCMS